MRALLLVALLAPLLVSAEAVSAQEIDPSAVQLRGWGLPEGTTVCGTARHGGGTLLADDAGGHLIRTQNAFVIGACFQARRVEEGSLEEALEWYVPARGNEKVWVEGRLVEAEPVEYTIADVRAVVIRDGDRWRRELAEGEPNTPDARFTVREERSFFDLDDAVYPADPVPVGHEWTLTARQILGMAEIDTTASYRGKMRLDSVGVWEGHPVAHVSYRVDGTTDGPEGARLAYVETGHRIRRLDDLFDVYIHRDVESAANLRRQGFYGRASSYRYHSKAYAWRVVPEREPLPEEAPSFEEVKMDTGVEGAP